MIAVPKIRRIHAHHRELWIPPSVRQAFAPGLTAVWPQCAVCKGPVEGYEVVHEGSKSLDILAKCHGKEDCLRIAWDDDGMTMSDFISQLQKTTFFHGLQDR